MEIYMLDKPIIEAAVENISMYGTFSWRKHLLIWDRLIRQNIKSIFKLPNTAYKADIIVTRPMYGDGQAISYPALSYTHHFNIQGRVWIEARQCCWVESDWERRADSLQQTAYSRQPIQQAAYRPSDRSYRPSTLDIQHLPSVAA